VVLRYFGPGTNPQAPSVGDYKKNEAKITEPLAA